MVNGVLVCSVCGKPAHGEQLEDKAVSMPEVKGKTEHAVMPSGKRKR